MRVAVFYPSSLWASWGQTHGLARTLSRMGHEVIPVGVDAQTGRCSVPKADQYDAAIISGPEHISKMVPRPKVPTVAWMHETVEREDYGKLDVENLNRSGDVIFCPGIQDEKYGFKYLPFGVDTEIFKPWDSPMYLQDGELKPHVKDIDAGFIGLLYPKRQEFLKKLSPHMKGGVRLRCGNVQVLEVDGLNPRKTAELYAENIRRMKVFVNLPSLSQLAVSKIYEVLACGTPILTHVITEDRNLESLPVHKYHDAEDLAKYLRGEHGCLEPTHNVSLVMKMEHSLESRCGKLIAALADIGAKAA